MSTLHNWLEAARLRTLPLSLSAVVLGGALASYRGAFVWKIFALSVLTAVLLQVLSNFANDYGDFKKGSDGGDRVGPARAVSTGAITARQMFVAIVLSAAVCFLSGVALMLVSFGDNILKWIIFIILGIASIAAAMMYTMGKHPYGYSGKGDVFVFIFFGLVAVAGSYALYPAPLLHMPGLPACAAGLLATAVININNIRDMESDKQHGKFTLALRLGQEKARQYHLMLVSGGIFCWAFYFILIGKPLGLLLLLFATPVLQSAYTVAKSYDPAVLDHQLKVTSVGSGLFQLAVAAGFFWIL